MVNFNKGYKHSQLYENSDKHFNKFIKIFSSITIQINILTNLQKFRQYDNSSKHFNKFIKIFNSMAIQQTFDHDLISY